MKKTPTRKEIQAALAPALIKALGDLAMTQDSISLCRGIRALVETAFDLAEAGNCPPAVMLEQLQHVARKRLPQLQTDGPVWMQAQAKA